MAQFKCESCGYEKQVDESMVDRIAKCKKCGSMGRVRSTAPPPPQEREQTVPELGEFRMGSVVDSIRERRQKNQTYASFFAIFFDIQFKHYITPVIVKITWVACLIQAAIIAIQEILKPWLRESSSSLRSFAQPSDFEGILWLAVKIIAYILALLWIRVILETAILFFHMAQSLKKIETNTNDSKDKRSSWKHPESS